MKFTQPLIIVLDNSEVNWLYQYSQLYPQINQYIRTDNTGSYNVNTNLIVKASEYNIDQIVLFLIKVKNIDPNFVDDETTYTPFLWTVRNNNKNLAFHLLRTYDINVNYQDNNGFTALHWACENQQLDMVIFLLDNKADVNVVNKDGYSPIFLAVSNNRISLEIVKCLLNRNAKTILKTTEDNFIDLDDLAFNKNCNEIQDALSKHKDSDCKLLYTYDDLDDFY